MTYVPGFGDVEERDPKTTGTGTVWTQAELDYLCQSLHGPTSRYDAASGTCMIPTAKPNIDPGPAPGTETVTVPAPSAPTTDTSTPTSSGNGNTDPLDRLSTLASQLYSGGAGGQLIAVPVGPQSGGSSNALMLILGAVVIAAGVWIYRHRKGGENG